MSIAIICTAPESFDIEALVSRLRRVAASAVDISLLVADRPGSIADTLATRLARRPTVRAAQRAGSIAGGVVGLLAGAGILTIPGMGLFLAAGPIVAALSAAAVGAAVGGLSGVLVGMGLSEVEAQHYEDKVREGCLLLAVRARRAADLVAVRRILERARLDDILVVSLPGQAAGA